jgi:glycosyltransferase involved in cell wall biosynthesis
MDGTAADNIATSDVLAISWFEHRRTRELCTGLGIELVLLDTTHRGLRRYLLLTARTIAVLVRQRPRVLLVQSPSLVLSVLAVILGGAFGYRLIVDAHNEAVVPQEHPQLWVRWLSSWVIRHAHLTIVTNRQLAEVVREQRGEPFVLPDRIPTPPVGATRTLGPGFNLVLIATFARDEPIAAIFEAVRGAEPELFVTGNPDKLPAAVAANAPPNVRFTGFLAEDEYWALLRAADAIVDLTSQPDCLVCGAYEALAVGAPMLLSNNRASVELFGEGALFTDNTAKDIRRALERLKSERASLRAAAALKRGELIAAWSLRAQGLLDMLQRWCAGSGRERVL